MQLTKAICLNNATTSWGIGPTSYTPFLFENCMQDKNEIIYMALSNQIILYEGLRADIEDPEELQMVEYIITRSLEILDSYADKIKEEDDKPIPKPKWK